MITYIIKISFDVGNMVDDIAEFENSVNSMLAMHGVDEKMKIKSAFEMKMQSDRELTKQEKSILIATLESQYAETKLGNVKVEGIRKSCRKSCIHKTKSR